MKWNSGEASIGMAKLSVRASLPYFLES